MNLASHIVPRSVALALLFASPALGQLQQGYLKPSNTGEDDYFGGALAVSGDTLVIGSVGEASAATGIDGDQLDNSAPLAGAAYVFIRTGTTWAQQAYLKASNAEAGDRFAKTVAISGNTIVIGASREDSPAVGANGDESTNNKTDSGAVYVFVRTGSTWTQQAYLKASNSDQFDYFGSQVTIDGDTIAVSAQREQSDASGVDGDQSSNAFTRAGAVYVFTRTGTAWSQQAYLKPSNPSVGIEFGSALDLSGDTLVATSPFNDQIDGTAYVFTRVASTWSQQALLKSSNGLGAGDAFGFSAAISGDTIAVGAILEDSDATGVNGSQGNDFGVFGSERSGAVYVFVRNGSNWSQEAYVKAINTGGQDSFGDSVAVSGDLLVVGAGMEDGGDAGVGGDPFLGGGFNTGAGYVFARQGTTWTQTVYIKASNAGYAGGFGTSVSLSGDTVLFGVISEGSNATGVDGDQTDISLPDAGAGYVFDLEVEIPVGVSFCFGDGGNQAGCTNCPCSNNALVGSGGGCLNSAGTSATLIGSGSTSLSLPSGSITDLQFSLTGAPPMAFCILNSGDGLAPTNMANPCFGANSGAPAVQFDGLRCAVTNTRRHGGRPADAIGEVGLSNSPWGGEGGPPAGLGAAGAGFAAGQTRYFQVINRDDMQQVCMRGLNTSQAVEITFTP